MVEHKLKGDAPWADEFTELAELREAARRVLDCWESGNLARAVNELRELLEFEPVTTEHAANCDGFCGEPGGCTASTV